MAKQKTTKKTVTVKSKAKSPSGPRRELNRLLDQLSDEDINWLITQAKTMIYNHKVEEVNQAAKDLADSRSTGTKKIRTSVPNTVDIVSAGGPKSFNIVLGNAHLFINLTELKALVKIAQAADSSGDGAGRIYRWCKRERGDIINDGGITGASDPRLAAVYEILRDRYTVG